MNKINGSCPLCLNSQFPSFSSECSSAIVVAKVLSFLRFSIKFEIKSSTKILFNYLSNASSLEEWFADKVTIREGDYVFHWEGSEQRAQIVSKKDNQMIRYKWVTDEKKDDTYFQILL